MREPRPATITSLPMFRTTLRWTGSRVTRMPLSSLPSSRSALSGWPSASARSSF